MTKKNEQQDYSRCIYVYSDYNRVPYSFKGELDNSDSINLKWPKTLMIEPTSKCNLSCPLCEHLFLRKEKSRDLKFNEFKNILNQFRDLENIYFWNFGEPYLNSETHKMIAYAKKTGIPNTYVSTNAHKLDYKKIILSGLDYLIVSLDGIRQESYLKYRVGGKFKLVIDNIRNICEYKKQNNYKNPKVILQFVINRFNEEDVKGVVDFARKLGVDELRLKTLNIGRFEDRKNEFLPKNFEYSRYKDDSLMYKAGRRENCSVPWYFTAITSKGDVFVCCKCDNNKDYVMGNIFKNSFDKIWQGDKYTEFRKGILKDINSRKICLNCSRNLDTIYKKFIFKDKLD